MIFRIFMMLAMVFTLTACSSKDKGMEQGPVVVQEDMTNMGGTGDNSMYSEDLAGPTAGSPQDFVVNVGDRVFFGYDRYDLTPEAQHTLQMQAEWLKRYPNVNVTVEGHCDERGTREYNLALGERRANSVKSYLVALGISPDRVNTISYGKERPAVVGTGASVWAQNRRGVTVIE